MSIWCLRTSPRVCARASAGRPAPRTGRAPAPGKLRLSPARPLTLAEATPAIEARLRETKAEQALRSSGEEKIKALRAAVASGKKFAEAAGEAGLKVESLNNLAPMGDTLTPEQRRVVSSTLALKDGELSAFETAPWGGLCVYLQSRGPLPDAELAAKREEIRQSLLENKRSLLFAEWLLRRLSRLK